MEYAKLTFTHKRCSAAHLFVRYQLFMNDVDEDRAEIQHVLFFFFQLGLAPGAQYLYL